MILGLIKHAIRDYFTPITQIHIYKGTTNSEHVNLAIIMDTSKPAASISCILAQNKCGETYTISQDALMKLYGKLHTDYKKVFEFDPDVSEHSRVKARLWICHSTTMKECAQSFTKEEIESDNEFVAYIDYSEYQRRKRVEKDECEAQKKKCVIM